MRVLVTGVTGFVGHHLAAHLRSAGHEVLGFVRDDGGGDGEVLPAGVTAHTGDLLDPDSVARAVRAAAPEGIVHLAGASSVGRSFAEPLLTWDVNLRGTLTVLEAARASASPPRCLVVTSGEVYGRVPPEGLPVDEDTPFTPLSPYGASKAAADLACVQYREAYGLPVVRVRAFNHVGPGQDPRFVIPNVARQLARAEVSGADHVEVHVGNTSTRRDFTDVRDMVRAYALLLERGDPDVPYLACTGHSVAVRDLVDELAGLCRIRATVVSDPALVRSGEQPDLYGSPRRLRRLGWTPGIPLRTTLQDTLDHWRAAVARGEA
jgi:GDP-4-dehydro-6-deoxy-D-mannose reductase